MRGKLLLCALLVAMSTKFLWGLTWIGFAGAVVPVENLPPKMYPLRVARVLDGDTVEGTIELGFGVQLASQSIRCLGYDAWESSKRRRSVKVTDEEVVKGKLASKYMEDLVKGPVWVVPGKRERDNYGRVRGELYVLVDGKPVGVADLMEYNGHTRREPGDAP